LAEHTIAVDPPDDIAFGNLETPEAYRDWELEPSLENRLHHRTNHFTK
jgi:hypothetical protein